MNTDKTPLEREIEKRELSQSPSFLYIIIVVLFIFTVALGSYTFILNKEKATHENTLITIQESLNNEIISLRQTIDQLQNENGKLKKKLQQCSPSPSKKKIGKKSHLDYDNINVVKRDLPSNRFSTKTTE